MNKERLVISIESTKDYSKGLSDFNKLKLFIYTLERLDVDTKKININDYSDIEVVHLIESFENFIAHAMKFKHETKKDDNSQKQG